MSFSDTRQRHDVILANLLGLPNSVVLDHSELCRQRASRPGCQPRQRRRYKTLIIQDLLELGLAECRNRLNVNDCDHQGFESQHTLWNLTLFSPFTYQEHSSLQWLGVSFSDPTF